MHDQSESAVDIGLINPTNCIVSTNSSTDYIERDCSESNVAVGGLVPSMDVRIPSTQSTITSTEDACIWDDVNSIASASSHDSTSSRGRIYYAAMGGGATVRPRATE